MCGRLCKYNSGFSQTHKIGIIANFVFPYICSFYLYLHQLMLFNVKLDKSGKNSIKFQGCRLHWSSSFLMAQIKQSWQYWHVCYKESLWKTLLHSLSALSVNLPHTLVNDTIIYKISCSVAASHFKCYCSTMSA